MVSSGLVEWLRVLSSTICVHLWIGQGNYYNWFYDNRLKTAQTMRFNFQSVQYLKKLQSTGDGNHVHVWFGSKFCR